MELAHRPTDQIAFGNQHAKSFRSVAAAQDEAMRLFQGLREYDFLDRADFQFRASAVIVNGLHVATATTPASRMLFSDRIESKLVFPFVGACSFRDGKTKLAIQTNDSAIFLPPRFGNVIEGAARSVVTTRIDDTRLKYTACVMLGPHFHESLAPHFSEMTPVALSHGSISFDAAFRQLFAMIDGYQDNQFLLDASGIDDTFYRILSMALFADAFASQKDASSTTRSRQMKTVCDYVMENINKRITLTDLEHIGHMSRRTLHNTFYKIFGVSPVEWVRSQRLIKARSLLSNPRSLQSVTEVLYACGFTHASLFSAQYKRRFGETPSQTLQQSQSRR